MEVDELEGIKVHDVRVTTSSGSQLVLADDLRLTYFCSQVCSLLRRSGELHEALQHMQSFV